MNRNILLIVIYGILILSILNIPIKLVRGSNNVLRNIKYFNESNNCDQYFSENELEIVIQKSLNNSNCNFKNITIISSNLHNLTNIFSNNINYTSCETIVIRNSSLVEVNLKIFQFPNLTFLDLSGNKITNFILNNIPNLYYLNLSNNNIFSFDDILINSTQKLDMSNNKIQRLSIRSSKLKYINLSNSLVNNNSINSSKNIIILEDIDEINLSNNNLYSLTFLRLEKNLKSLILTNNYIKDMNCFFNLKNSFSQEMRIELRNNPLECSIKLTLNMSSLKEQKINFNDDLECKFANCTHSYNIAKYGWTFENEKLSFSAKLKDDISNARFWITADKDKVTVNWRRRLDNIYPLFLSLKSKENKSLHISKLLVELDEYKMLFPFHSMSQVNEACIGLRLQSTPSHCQIVKEMVDLSMENRSVKTALIVVSVMLAISVIILIFLIIYLCYLRKMRSKINPVENVEMESYDKKNIHKQSIDTFNKHAPVIPDFKMEENNKGKKKKASTIIGNTKSNITLEKNSYITMNSTYPQHNDDFENIYEGVESHNHYQDSKEIEDIYDSV